jgi:aspartate ammonia-lyase
MSASEARFRTEKDDFGTAEIPVDALYGIHTWRAVQNFQLLCRPVHPAVIHAYGEVKLACARTNHELGRWETAVFDAITAACDEMRRGQLDKSMVVDALQGGAGTSTNMNVNEVLTNRALQFLGDVPGHYDRLHPLDDLNLHQSTNDTFPTAVRIAAIRRLRVLQGRVICLQEAFQQREKDMAHVVKIGRTEFQDAVLTTLGRTMGAFAEAFARDRWRLYKCEERLRVINLGGTAIGTGLGAPREYIFRVTDVLRDLTGLGLARAENLVEATQNADVFIEVSGMLKACAGNLVKVCGDLRLLSSGPDAGLGELALPALQSGSSIMPGKVNPVIPECATQAALLTIGLDMTITQAASAGNPELNAFMPLIADCLLQQIDLLSQACDTLDRLCVRGLQPNEAACRRHLNDATAVITALVGDLGYRLADEVAQDSRRTGQAIRDIVLSRNLMAAERFDSLVSPEAVMRLGVPQAQGGSHAANP